MQLAPVLLPFRVSMRVHCKVRVRAAHLCILPGRQPPGDRLPQRHHVLPVLAHRGKLKGPGSLHPGLGGGGSTRSGLVSRDSMPLQPCHSYKLSTDATTAILPSARLMVATKVTPPLSTSSPLTCLPTPPSPPLPRLPARTRSDMTLLWRLRAELLFCCWTGRELGTVLSPRVGFGRTLGRLCKDWIERWRPRFPLLALDGGHRQYWTDWWTDTGDIGTGGVGPHTTGNYIQQPGEVQSWQI